MEYGCPAPYMEISVQPDFNGKRFRYACEGKPTFIQGENSTTRQKTIPEVRVCHTVIHPFAN